MMISRTFIAVWLLSFYLNGANAKSNENEAIKIILNNWSSQLVASHILGTIYENQGYKVEYVSYPTDGQWYILKHNIAHIQVEVWEGTMAEKSLMLINKKQLLDAGNYNVFTREDWWYPDYVEEKCPGLPNWQALKHCSQLFSEKDNVTKGIYYGGPWEKPDKARVRSLKLNFQVINVNHADQLWIKLRKAYEQKKPILLFNWTPNWVGAKYKGKFVEFPEFSPLCESDPNWGINPDYLYDCGNPKAGWLKKVASTEFPLKWPCAYTMLTKMNFNNTELEEIAALVDVTKLTPTQAANYWLDNNKHRWQSWLDNGCST
ncbi:ABC transporter substrate-binding protein [Pseudoalteromonas sp.]|uniref:ABC transporter substrate-binding protein n=1 Tax=Pseudoalteromonas sp. TaxID=53249 RepID=UPI003569A798